jgi:ubiquinone/menaquinone biosynthesis C-methylase UbiE
MVNAVDIDAEILGRGDPQWRTHERVCWENGDIRTMPLSPDSYDGVLACNVLHWLLDDAEIVGVISRLCSVTRPGGLNGIVVFNDRRPYPESSAPRPPRLLPHKWYLDRYRTWEVLRESDMDSTHTHPGETIEHSHAITRIVARRPLVPAADPGLGD